MKVVDRKETVQGWVERWDWAREPLLDVLLAAVAAFAVGFVTHQGITFDLLFGSLGSCSYYRLRVNYFGGFVVAAVVRRAPREHPVELLHQLEPPHLVALTVKFLVFFVVVIVVALSSSVSFLLTLSVSCISFRQGGGNIQSES